MERGDSFQTTRPGMWKSVVATYGKLRGSSSTDFRNDSAGPELGKSLSGSGVSARSSSGISRNPHSCCVAWQRMDVQRGGETYNVERPPKVAGVCDNDGVKLVSKNRAQPTVRSVKERFSATYGDEPLQDYPQRAVSRFGTGTAKRGKVAARWSDYQGVRKGSMVICKSPAELEIISRFGRLGRRSEKCAR